MRQQQFPARPSQGKFAPLEGSALHAVKSVGVMST